MARRRQGGEPPPPEPGLTDWLRAIIRNLSGGIQPDTSVGAETARRALELGGAVPQTPPSLVPRWMAGALERFTGASPAQAAVPPAGGRQPEIRAPGVTSLAGLARAQGMRERTWNLGTAAMARAAGLRQGNLGLPAAPKRPKTATRRGGPKAGY